MALVTDIAADALDPEEALELVGLGARLDHFPDEPTGALDRRTGSAGTWSV